MINNTEVGQVYPAAGGGKYMRNYISVNFIILLSGGASGERDKKRGNSQRGN